VPRDAPESEAWFDEYVRSHDQDPGEAEPDLGIEKNPDRLINWNGHQVVCEIKQFESNPFARLLGTVGTLSTKEVLGQVRRKVARAAKQLKPLAGSDWPLVVVLANPKGQPVAFSTDEVIWALFGDPIIQLTISTASGASTQPPLHTVGRNSRLLFNHQYLSAVVALRRASHRQVWRDAYWQQLKAEHPDLDPADIEALVTLAQRADEAEEAALVNGEIEEGDYLYVEVFTATSSPAPGSDRTLD
jgi:hypothetical protein